MSLLVKLLVPEARSPVRGSSGAAGYDLASVVDVVVPARGRALVSTGLAVVVPPGTYGRVAPRSGLAVRHGIDVLAGVIDEDYRGPLTVVLANTGESDFVVSAGDRIAQLVLISIRTPEVVIVGGDLGDTQRGASGFGSTGVSSVGTQTSALVLGPIG